MPRGDRKVGRLLGEFAPGIPEDRAVLPIPRVGRSTPQMWDMASQIHEADRAGRHMDLRLVDPRGRAHSWALPQARLPGPGEKVLVVQQPTHTKDYAAKKGTFQISEGYGAGRAHGSGLKPVEVVSSRPGVLRFNVYEGRTPQEFALVQTPKGQLLHNFTSTRKSGVRGAGGHAIPDTKPKYRETKPDLVNFSDDNEIHQAKLDGAHVTYHIPAAGKQVRVFSYRPTERETGVIEHTHKLPAHRGLTAPPGLAGTVLRGELWAADRSGRALPAERVGGLLNASVMKSRELQGQHGSLRTSIFDVVRYKGRPASEIPYEQKLQILREVEGKMPRLRLPPTAESPREKERLFSRVQSGKLKETSEGIVAWRRDDPRPTKMKFRPDVDAEVVGVFEGKGKHEGRAGGLEVKLPGKDSVTRVGTGFSDRQREQLWKDKDSVVGRVARVETQQVFPSGKLRAPSFKEFHIEKGKQPEKTACARVLEEHLERLGIHHG